MDDKEKEKFGVIIDKNDQDTENQPKVDESTEDKNIYKESVTTSSETSTNPEEKQPESDKTSDVLDKNETGILSFRGPNIFAGYLNNSEKTKKVFSDDGWFLTGDLGRMDEDGFIFIEGRLSRFSKIGGEMVSHESVEDAITGLLSVDGHTNDDINCAVIGIADESKGECLVLLTTSEVNSRWLGEELRNKGIPNLWIPRQIKQVKEIPVLGTGKLDLRKLKELAEN